MSFSSRPTVFRSLDHALSMVCFALVAVAPLACTVTETPSQGGAKKATKAAVGVETLGVSCATACDSGDDRKCVDRDTTCATSLCLVDVTQDISHLAYCTVDCTDAICPTGWHCEGVVSFAARSVAKACVADAATCGDGVVELGECDHPDTCASDCESGMSSSSSGVQEPATCAGICAQLAAMPCGEPVAPPEKCETDCQAEYGKGCDAELNSDIKCTVESPVTCGDYGQVAENCLDEATAVAQCLGILN